MRKRKSSDFGITYTGVKLKKFNDEFMLKNKAEKDWGKGVQMACVIVFAAFSLGLSLDRNHEPVSRAVMTAPPLITVLIFFLSFLFRNKTAGSRIRDVMCTGALMQFFGTALCAGKESGLMSCILLSAAFVAASVAGICSWGRITMKAIDLHENVPVQKKGNSASAYSSAGAAVGIALIPVVREIRRSAAADIVAWLFGFAAVLLTGFIAGLAIGDIRYIRFLQKKGSVK